MNARAFGCWAVWLLAASGCAPELISFERSGAGPAVVDASRELAHFVTHDGEVGFVLQRRGERASLQRDGERAIYELERAETRQAGVLREWLWVDASGRTRLRESLTGELFWLDDGVARPVRWRGAASPLPPPTVARAHHASPRERLQAQAADWQARSLVALRPGLRPQDAWRWSTLDSALAEFEPRAWAHVRAGASFRACVDSASIPSERGWVSLRWPGAGAAEWVFVLSPMAQQAALWQRVEPSPPAPGTPGVVWSVDGQTLQFVGADGRCHQTELSAQASPLEPGPGPVAAWPTPPAAPWPLDDAWMSARAQQQALDAEEARQWQLAERHRARYLGCAEQLAQRMGRHANVGLAVRRRASERARVQCRSALDGYAGAMQALAEHAHAQQRRVWDGQRAHWLQQQGSPHR